MSVEYEWIEIVPMMLKMQERLYVANGYTRVAHGVAMHRCATTPDCAGGCVMTRSPAMGQLWRDGDGRWVRR